MKSDRLLSILLLLQTHGRLAARELADRLEVSERTIHRDVEALSSAGVPVYAERGRHGGFALVAGYRTDVSGLTSNEAAALFVFAGRGTLADLGLEDDLKTALRKLMSVLPEAHRPEARHAQERVVVDPHRWLQQREELPHLAHVREAVWRGRRLRFRYRAGGASQVKDRLVDPYGLVAKAGVWYLIAASDGEPRLYRLSRMESATVTEERANRPPGLDLEGLWEQLRGRVEERGARAPVRLRVRSDRLDMLLRLCRPQLVGPSEEVNDAGDGWTQLRLAFVAEGAARGSLLGFGADVEVLEPPCLRWSMADSARQLLALYEPASTTGG